MGPEKEFTKYPDKCFTDFHFAKIPTFYWCCDQFCWRGKSPTKRSASRDPCHDHGCRRLLFLVAPASLLQKRRSCGPAGRDEPRNCTRRGHTTRHPFICFSIPLHNTLKHQDSTEPMHVRWASHVNLRFGLQVKGEPTTGRPFCIRTLEVPALQTLLGKWS